jgi:hypothetical protein
MTFYRFFIIRYLREGYMASRIGHRDGYRSYRNTHSAFKGDHDLAA